MNAANAFITLASLTYVVFFVFWIYPQYRTDCFRFELFSLRDQLFRDAADKNISFDNDAYKTMRSTINGFIRFADSMSLNRVLVMQLLQRGKPAQKMTFKKHMQEITSDLPQEQREAILSYMHRMNIEFVVHVLKKSMPVMLIAYLIRFLRALVGKSGMVVRVIEKYEKPIGRIDTAALAAGR